MIFVWLGWQDLNLRMHESKSCALPLGDTPSMIGLFNFLILPLKVVAKLNIFRVVAYPGLEPGTP